MLLPIPQAATILVRMRRIISLLVAAGSLAAAIALMAPASAGDGDASPIFGIRLPAGYRSWQLMTVAHEEGKLNDLRAILGNDVAIKAAREGVLPYPDGSIIARVAWGYEPLAESSEA